ncbi:hypothetical protein ATANTOWER_009682 [Ataeniobius toweri]|uniref:Uncharacterized protein n=1 Tax=Ataeniobius toweri TaxID=208326 RepID=A0ABU7BAI3_9TELE|nr:hypothetical protein [Ataeniobius toweri]
MGNCVRKQPPLEGDVKFMHSKDPDTVKNLAKWQKDYDFKGHLSVPACTHLVQRLQQKDKLRKRKKPSQELIRAKYWLAEAHKRKAGNDKKSKEVFIAVAREGDNDTGVVRGRGSQPQLQPAAAAAIVPEPSAPVGQITEEAPSYSTPVIFRVHKL